MNMRGKECLDEAFKIINGERQDVYGDPEDSFKFIAELWTAYIQYVCCDKPNGAFTEAFICLTSEDVAKMMLLLKVARGNKHDNFVDICGYAALADSILNSEQRNNNEPSKLE